MKLDQKCAALGVGEFRLLNYDTRWVVRMLEGKFPFDLDPSRIRLKVGVVCCEAPLITIKPSTSPLPCCLSALRQCETVVVDGGWCINFARFVIVAGF